MIKVLEEIKNNHSISKTAPSSKIKMCVFPLDNGILKGMTEKMLWNGAIKQKIDLPIWTVFIDHPDGKILFDTGMSRYICQKLVEVKEHQILPNVLRNYAISPQDIDYVICSHLHFDHSGYLGLFKKAEIIISKEEYTEVKKQYLKSNLDESYIYTDVKDWFSVNMNWKLLDGEEIIYKLVDGVHILNLGRGHSYGMLALLLELPQYGNVVIAGDLIYCQKNIQAYHQRQNALIDKKAYDAAFDQLIKIAKKYNAEIWFGHDQEQFTKIMKKSVYV